MAIQYEDVDVAIGDGNSVMILQNLYHLPIKYRTSATSGEDGILIPRESYRFDRDVTIRKPVGINVLSVERL